MFSNFKRAVSLTLLASVANVVFAAPAPVSDINSNNSATSSSVNSGPETDVQRLERLLSNSSRVQLSLQQQIDGMASEISELRGMVERNSYNMKQMLDRQRELFIELDRVKSQKQPTANQAAENTGSEATGGVYSADVNEEAAYKKAVYLVQVDKNYTGALDAFAKFQKDFPNSSYIANSHYWVGQLNFALKKDVEAAKSFASVVAYKDSNKRADSLVKLGDIAARNGKQPVANKYYQQAIDDYPGSASANLAESKIK